MKLALDKCEKVSLHEGALMDVLNFSARQGDLELAERMQKALEALGVTLEEQHYAPIIEIHAAKKNFSEALAVFDAMKSNGIEPSRGSAELLITPLADEWERIDDIYPLVEAKRDKGEHVNIHILNAFLAAARVTSDLHRAMAYYRSFESFAHAPNSDTLNRLLSNCIVNNNEVLAQDIWDEITKSGVEPDHRAYKKIIHLSSRLPDYESAFHWLEEMKLKGIKPDGNLYDNLIRRLVWLRDPRAKVALEEMGEQGHEVSGALRRAVEHMNQNDRTPGRGEYRRRGPVGVVSDESSKQRGVARSSRPREDREARKDAADGGEEARQAEMKQAAQ